MLLGNNVGNSVVRVYLGNMASQTTATITFRVTINDPLPEDVGVVTNQGVITGSNFDPVYTDDPVTVTPDDPTHIYVLPPTAVSLVWRDGWFNADGTVTIAWATVAEDNNAGFNIYRSAHEDGAEAEMVAFVPSQATGTAPDGGWQYRYTESTPDAGLWRYWVVDVDLSGGVRAMASTTPITALAPKMLLGLPTAH